MNKSLVRRTFFLGIFVAMLLAIGCHYFLWWPRALERTISYLVYPVLLLQHKCVAPIKSWFTTKATMQEYETAFQQLRHERDELSAQVTYLQSVANFTTDVQEVASFKARYTCADAKLVQILVKQISHQGHFFIIDAGEKKGVTTNMVAVYKNHLVGRVVHVYPYYSKVVLITDATCKVSAYCAATKASGIHAGCNQQSCGQLLHVSHLQTVQEGDMVLSSGDGLMFPRGFALGKVITSTKRDLLYDITTQPLIDLQSLDYCYLLQKGSETISYIEPEQPEVAVAPRPSITIPTRPQPPVDRKVLVVEEEESDFAKATTDRESQNVEVEPHVVTPQIAEPQQVTMCPTHTDDGW